LYKRCKEKRLLLEIPESFIELGWLSHKGNTREGVVRAYILKHLEIFNHPEILKNPDAIRDLAIENLVALNVWLNNWEKGHNREVDLVFEKGGVYYLVETKREGQYSNGWSQLGDIVDCFKSEFKKHQMSYKALIPILVTTAGKINEIESRWFD
jgi:hypothetical protein